MVLATLPIQYLVWHYTRGFRDLLGIIVNFFWFVGNLFSVKTLLLTLFRPLQLIHEDPVSLLQNPAVFFENLVVNFIMRIVGFVIRTLLIVVALLSWSVLTVLGTVLVAVWIVLPPGVLLLIVQGTLLLL